MCVCVCVCARVRARVHVRLYKWEKRSSGDDFIHS